MKGGVNPPANKLFDFFINYLTNKLFVCLKLTINNELSLHLCTV